MFLQHISPIRLFINVLGLPEGAAEERRKKKKKKNQQKKKKKKVPKGKGETHTRTDAPKSGSHLRML